MLILKKEGEVFSKAFLVGSTYYVLKLKSRKDFPESKLTKKDLQKAADSGHFMESFWLYNKLSAQLQQSY